MTAKERNLLTILCGSLFLFGNLWGLPAINDQQKTLKKRLEALRTEEVSSKTWLKESAQWTERKTWLDDNQPLLSSSGDASSSFLEMLQQTARDNNIKLSDQKLLDSKAAPGFQSVAVRVTANGTMESLTKWLYAVQQPKLFQAITSFTLKMEGDAPNMRCDLDLARWYAPR